MKTIALITTLFIMTSHIEASEKSWQQQQEEQRKKAAQEAEKKRKEKEEEMRKRHEAECAAYQDYLNSEDCE